MPTQLEIGRQRLHNQLITRHKASTPLEVVRRLGMVQAQDYLGALWAVGLRCQNGVEADIEKALAERKIVRTWPARGTLHFVAAEDARWLLALLTPRVISGAKGRYRQLGLDESDFERGRKIFSQALKGGNLLTRPEMYRELQAGGVSSEGQRGIHILGRLAQDGLICFGPRQGKQQTFVLLEEWLPPAPALTREEALAEITRRYFTGHAPGSLQDFAWWTGLSNTDAKNGLEMAEDHLESIEYEGQIFWQPRGLANKTSHSSDAVLLPAFDEYLVGYKDRSAVLEPRFARLHNAGGGILNPAIVIGGMVVGTWKRTLNKGKVSIVPGWFTEPEPVEVEVFLQAANRYADFLGLAVSIG